MRFGLASCAALLSAGLTACSNGHSGAAAGAASSGAAPAPASEAGRGPSPDSGTAPAGLPAGYRVRTDDPKKAVADIKFTTTPAGAIDDNAGTHNQNLAHILYRAADSASGAYVLRTEIDQVGSPEHPEAVGVLIGGRDLAGPAQRYGYFILRGDGQYAVKRRDGDSASTVEPFTASANLPKADAARHVSYAITVRVGADSVRLLVADKPIVAVVRSAIPSDGIAGFRINHGLHVVLTPLAISH